MGSGTVPSYSVFLINLSFELPSGQPMTMATNGYASGRLTLTALTGQLSVVNATAYGGITLAGISTGSSTTVAIDAPTSTPSN